MEKMLIVISCLVTLVFPPRVSAAGLSPWDIDKDGIVGFGDLAILTKYFGEDRTKLPKSEPDPDVNGDGMVDVLDLVLVGRHFGDLCRNLRAVHMGGNWGTNKRSIYDLPTGYSEYLRDLNVNWVGISVALHLDDSMDSTVERRYSGVGISTFTDEALVGAIRTLRQYGFNVYLTLAFENLDGSQHHPVSRWQLGDPYMTREDRDILPEFWPWRLDHPDHERFVSEFWKTYAEQAVHFGKIAELEGVGLYSLGTETERLFRCRSGGRWPNDFGAELKAMVHAVREVYSGLLTYDMHYGALTHSDFYGPGSDYLWEDIGLDVVGISAYFRLTDAAPDAVLSVDDLEARWEHIFQSYLLPLQNRDPGRPILFLEFGYVDSTASPYISNSDAFTARVFSDANGNNLDDGEETQANIYQAFFNVMDRYPGVIGGAFLWDNWMASDDHYAKTFAHLRSCSIRWKLAEEVVKERYGTWR